MPPVQSSPRSSENHRARYAAATTSPSLSASSQGDRDRDERGGRARPGTISAHGPIPASAKHLTAKEQAAADEAKEKLERMVKVEALAGKRRRFFSYLKKTHQQGSFWLNCVKLTRKGDLAVYAAELPPDRVLRLFYLGMGLAKLLQSNGGAQLIRGILQLLEEWEYHFSLGGVAHQSMKAIRARNVDGPSRDHCHSWDIPSNEQSDKQHEQMVGRLLKFNNEVVYEHLLTPQVPFPLDYLEVVLSVCDIMCLIYAKFVEEECYKKANVYEGLVRVDNKIKHHIINVFAKEFTDMSTSIARAELRTLR